MPACFYTIFSGRFGEESKNLSQRVLLITQRDVAFAVGLLFLHEVWVVVAGPVFLSNVLELGRMTAQLQGLCTSMLPECAPSGAVDMVVDGGSTLLFKPLLPVLRLSLDVGRWFLTECAGPISSWSQGLGLSAHLERSMFFYLEGAAESWMELR